MSGFHFKKLIIISLTVLTYPCSGQILRVDKNHISSDSSGYMVGTTDAIFSMNNRGSTESEEVFYVGARFGFDLVGVWEKSATIWIATINYTKIGGGPFISNGAGHLRHIFRRNAKLTPETFVQLQYDRSRNMQRRQLIGAGLRYNILQGANSLHYGLGIMNEDEQWRNVTEIVNRNIWKLNTFFGGEVDLSKTVVFNSIFYFQTGEDKKSNVYRSRATGHAEIKNQLTEHLKAKIIGELTWDQRPIIPLNNLTFEIFFGLEYNFGL